MAGQLPAGDRLRRLRWVGRLVLAASLLVAALVLVMVARAVWAPQARYVVRPELSVHGVTVGSPVRLNGVVVGRVARVGLWSDPKDGRVRPEVVLSLDVSVDPNLALLGERVADGLRVGFVPVNPASGFLETDLVWLPGSPCLRATNEPDELPWQPSSQQQALARAIAALRPLANADLRPKVESLLAGLSTAEARLAEGPAALASLSARAARLREGLSRIESAVDSDDLAELHGRLGEVREGLRVATAALDALDRDLAAWPGPLGEALREFSRSCRDSADRLRREVPESAR